MMVMHIVAVVVFVATCFENLIQSETGQVVASIIVIARVLKVSVVVVVIRRQAIHCIDYRVGACVI